MNLYLYEPGKIIQTIDGDRRRIRTFLITDSGLPVEYDNDRWPTLTSESRLDITEVDQ